MDKVNFKSNIRIVPYREYCNITQRIGIVNSSNYPWTIKQSVLARNAYTGNIRECSALGLTDGDKVFLTHLCPTMSQNKCFKEINNFIESVIQKMNKEYLQGFLLGAKKNNPISLNLFENLENLLKAHGIPSSIFKSGKEESYIAYNTSSDEWVIFNKYLSLFNNPEKELLNCFDTVKLSEKDIII